MKVRTFRDLVAWQRGMELARPVYHATEAIQANETFELVKQMRQAAISIPSNIAEGHGRQSRPDYLRHLRIARGSLAELITQSILAVDLKLMQSDERLRHLLLEEDRLLQALIRRLEEKSGRLM